MQVKFDLLAMAPWRDLDSLLVIALIGRLVLLLVWPKDKSAILIGALAGTVIGIGWAFTRDHVFPNQIKEAIGIGFLLGVICGTLAKGLGGDGKNRRVRPERNI